MTYCSLGPIWNCTRQARWEIWLVLTMLISPLHNPTICRATKMGGPHTVQRPVMSRDVADEVRRATIFVHNTISLRKLENDISITAKLTRTRLRPADNELEIDFMMHDKSNSLSYYVIRTVRCLCPFLKFSKHFSLFPTIWPCLLNRFSRPEIRYRSFIGRSLLRPECLNFEKVAME